MIYLSHILIYLIIFHLPLNKTVIYAAISLWLIYSSPFSSKMLNMASKARSCNSLGGVSCEKYSCKNFLVCFLFMSPPAARPWDCQSRSTRGLPLERAGLSGFALDLLFWPDLALLGERDPLPRRELGGCGDRRPGLASFDTATIRPPLFRRGPGLKSARFAVGSSPSAGIWFLFVARAGFSFPSPSALKSPAFFR